MRRTIAGLACLAAWGCSLPEAEPERLGAASQAAIYGDDDRTEVFAEPDPLWRSHAARSVVALVQRRLPGWSFCNDRASPESAVSVGEHHDLCPGERFFEQPAAADCSGTLIDDDLVLTAGHCVDDDDAAARCKGMRVVFGYLYPDEDELGPISLDEVYSCRRVVARPPGSDAVILQLDRPVATPHAPAAVLEGDPAAGSALRLLGFPSGMPMKIAGDCSAVDVDRQGGIAHDCDALSGNSGSGLLDARMRVVGVLTHVTGDYAPSGPDGCFQPAWRTEEGLIPDSGVEVPQWGSATPPRHAIEELCATGWPSSRLCGKAASCGDGACSGLETSDACPDDCAPPACGDAVCDRGEDHTCAPDCGEAAGECDEPTPDAGAGAGAGPVEEAPPVPRVDEGGCGYAGRPRGAASSLALMLVLAGWRRHRAAGVRRSSQRRWSAPSPRDRRGRRRGACRRHRRAVGRGPRRCC